MMSPVAHSLGSDYPTEHAFQYKYISVNARRDVTVLSVHIGSFEIDDTIYATCVSDFPARKYPENGKMLEGNDPHYLKKHPEIYKRMCYELITQISEKFCSEIPPRLGNTFTQEIKPALETSLKKRVDEIWNVVNVDTKVANFLTVIENTRSDEPQWRPKTGEVDLSNETLSYNSIMKHRWSKEIEAKKKEIEELEKIITEKRNQIDEQMVEMTKVLTDMNYSSKKGNQNKIIGSKKK